MEKAHLKYESRFGLEISKKIDDEISRAVQFKRAGDFNKANEIVDSYWQEGSYYYLLAQVNDSVLSSSYFDSCRYVLPKLPKAKLQNFQYHAYIVDYFLKNNFEAKNVYFQINFFLIYLKFDLYCDFEIVYLYEIKFYFYMLKQIFLPDFLLYNTYNQQ